MRIFGYPKQSVNEHGLHEMSEVTFDVSLETYAASRDSSSILPIARRRAIGDPAIDICPNSMRRAS